MSNAKQEQEIVDTGLGYHKCGNCDQMIDLIHDCDHDCDKEFCSPSCVDQHNEIYNQNGKKNGSKSVGRPTSKEAPKVQNLSESYVTKKLERGSLDHYFSSRKTVHIDQISDKLQLRDRNNESFVQSIVENFDPNQLGTLILQDLENGEYLLIDGNHRYAALEQLGIDKVPCVIYSDLDAYKAKVNAYKANNNRQPFKMSEKVRIVSDLWKEANEINPDISYSEFEKQVNETETTIKDYVKVSKMHIKVLGAIDEGFSVYSAVAMSKLSYDDQAYLINKFKNLTVKETRRRVKIWQVLDDEEKEELTAGKTNWDTLELNHFKCWQCGAPKETGNYCLPCAEEKEQLTKSKTNDANGPVIEGKPDKIISEIKDNKDDIKKTIENFQKTQEAIQNEKIQNLGCMSCQNPEVAIKANDGKLELCIKCGIDIFEKTTKQLSLIDIEKAQGEDLNLNNEVISLQHQLFELSNGDLLKKNELAKIRVAYKHANMEVPSQFKISELPDPKDIIEKMRRCKSEFPRKDIPEINGQPIMEYIEDGCYSYTFDAEKVKEFVLNEIEASTLNLFAGKNILSKYIIRVDMNAEMNQLDYVGTAAEFLDYIIDNDIRFNTLIYDPPWNERKSKEFYDGNYIGKFTKLKEKISNIIKPGGKIISVGYEISNFGKKRGFKIEKLAVVNSFGEIRPYFIVVERKE